MTSIIGDRFDSLVRGMILYVFNNPKYFKTTVNSGGHAMYELLIREGILIRDEEQIKENFLLAVEQNKPYIELMKIQAKDYKKNLQLINHAKSLCVDNWFIDLRMNDQHPRTFITGPLIRVA